MAALQCSRRSKSELPAVPDLSADRWRPRATMLDPWPRRWLYLRSEWGGEGASSTRSQLLFSGGRWISSLQRRLARGVLIGKVFWGEQQPFGDHSIPGGCIFFG